MRKANLVDFADIIRHATTLGYKWNDACDLLDDVRPTHESYCMDYNINDEEEWREDFEWSEEVINVLKTFMKSNKIEEMTVINE